VFRRFLIAVLWVGATAVVWPQTPGIPFWAYGYLTPHANSADYSARCTGANPQDCDRGTLPQDPKNTPRRVPGSDRTFTLAEINARYAPADWFPGDHPPMPDIVAHGKESIGLRACAMCHLPNGQGLMQNAPVAGLPVDYFLRQIADFSSGKRHSADLNKANGFEMAAIARNLTPAEARAAAEYFAAIPFKPWVKVVESDTVPKYTASINGLFLKAPGTETEPIGRRIIEMPEDTEQTNLLRNPRAGFVAYVPTGSVAKGEAMAKGCLTCHGADLRGSTLGPPIAGRQASYLARQLFDFQKGARNGDMAKLMKPAVDKLTEDDVIALVAFVSSRQP
jgi:cytochrome c553